jgi:hypothetical protein
MNAHAAGVQREGRRQTTSHRTHILRQVVATSGKRSETAGDRACCASAHAIPMTAIRNKCVICLWLNGGTQAPNSLPASNTWLRTRETRGACGRRRHVPWETTFLRTGTNLPAIWGVHRHDRTGGAVLNLSRFRLIAPRRSLSRPAAMPLQPFPRRRPRAYPASAGCIRQGASQASVSSTGCCAY